MRKVIFLVHASLDGYAARPDGDMSWTIYNEELEAYSHTLHDTTDAAIYGRVTYEMMADYWPGVLDDPDADEGALQHARWVDKATKIVFSKTVDRSTWKNTVFIRDNIAEEMQKIKAKEGKDIWLLGSPSIAREFMRLGLIDEYRINVTPIILGGGLSIFAELDVPMNLTLVEAQTFAGGVVGLIYTPKNS
jgi:dihydrofolate reductase